MQSLEKHLHSTLYKIKAGSDRSTGFGIAPRVVLTVAHGLGQGDVAAFTMSGHQVEVCEVLLDKKADLAVLLVKDAAREFAPLIPECALDDPLYTFGFTEAYPDGEPVTLGGEGFFETDQLECLKVKNGQVVPGFSGAPILNLRTGGVCAITAKTRDRYSSLGGRAISVRELWNRFPQFNDIYKPDHQTHSNWTGLVSPLRDIDRTFLGGHYGLPDDELDVRQLMIEPKYTRVRLLDTDLTSLETCRFVDDALQILESQQILFLFGPYGSGKTLLSKIIQHRFFDKLSETHFFQCSDLSDSLDRIETYCRRRPITSNRCLMVFDGFDETSLLAKGRSDTQHRLLKHILRLLHNSDVYVVVNSRLIPTDTDEAYLGLSLLAHDELGRRSVDVLTVEHYGDREIEQWLDAYANIGATAGVEHRLYRDNLKHLHKNLHKACKNPLFLYMLSRTFRDGRTAGLGDVYDIYSQFVDRTVAGKFSGVGRASPHQAIKEVQKTYREFLRTLALALDSTGVLTYEASDLENWGLDGNAKIFGIPYKDVRTAVEDTAKQVIESELLEDIDRSRLPGNVLACYFLEEVEGRWRFRDNNIVFFLLAEILFEGLKQGFVEGSATKTLQDTFRDIATLQQIPIHPVSINMLRHRLRRLDDVEKAALIRILHELYHSGVLVKQRGLVASAASALRLKVLLVVTLLTIYTDSYRDMPKFFEDVAWLARVLEARDRAGFDVLRASFRGARYREARWVGASFDDYDFSGSTFQDCEFRRSELLKPRLDHVSAENLMFRLCEIDDLDVETLTGNVYFNQCEKVAARFRDTTALTLTLTDCGVRSLIVQGKQHVTHARVNVRIERCKVEQLILRDLTVRDLVIVDSEYPTIKVEGSNVRYDISTSKCSSRHRWRDDGATVRRVDAT